jgi:hypothetical protein
MASGWRHGERRRVAASTRREMLAFRMRIWDLEPALLCRQHLLGEHRELHGLWNILVEGKRGYAAHPETRRWAGKLAALFRRHEALVAEMERRGYCHVSPLPAAHATGAARQDVLITPLAEQLALLRGKPCGCPLAAATASGAVAGAVAEPVADAAVRTPRLRAVRR